MSTVIDGPAHVADTLDVRGELRIGDARIPFACRDDADDRLVEVMLRTAYRAVQRFIAERAA